MRELLTIDGYLLMTLEDAPALQALFEQCREFVELVAGRPPLPNEAEELYNVLPPGKSYEDKLTIGIFTNSNELIGVIDAVCAYPKQDEWYLGLLMLEPGQRNHGLGEAIYRTFAWWAAEHGAQYMRIAVAEQNEKGYRFWRRMGFQEFERKSAALFGAKESTMIIMRHALSVPVVSVLKEF